MSKRTVRSAMSSALSVLVVQLVGCSSSELPIPTVSLLMEQLQNKDQGRGPRLDAAEALGNRGPSAKEAIPTLAAVSLDKQEDKEIRHYAIRSLGAMKTREALPPLLDTLTDEDNAEDLRLQAVQSACALGPAEANEVLKSLYDELEDPHRVHFRLIAEAFCAVGRDMRWASRNPPSSKREDGGVDDEANYLLYDLYASYQRLLEALDEVGRGSVFDDLRAFDLVLALDHIGHSEFAKGLIHAQPHVYKTAFEAVAGLNRGKIFDHLPAESLQITLDQIGPAEFAGGLVRTQLHTYKRAMEAFSDSDRGAVFSHLPLMTSSPSSIRLAPAGWLMVSNMPTRLRTRERSLHSRSSIMAKSLTTSTLRRCGLLWRRVGLNSSPKPWSTPSQKLSAGH